MSETTKKVSADNAPINNSMDYAKKYNATYEDDGGDAPSGGSALVVNVTATLDPETDVVIYTFGKTAGEVWQAGVASVYYELPEGQFNKVPITQMTYEPNAVELRYSFSDYNGNLYLADTAEDYPATGSGPK